MGLTVCLIYDILDCYHMLISVGTQERLISETTVQAGSTAREGSILSDSLLATLWVNDLTSGTLDVSVYTLTDTGREVLLFSFPTLSATTTNLLLKKSGVSMQRFRVVVGYTGICSYEVYIRAIAGAGESSAKITGASSFTTDQIPVPMSPTVLIASALVDRQGLVLKNWSVAGNLFLSEDSSKLPTRGWALAPKDALALDVSAGVTVWGISDSGTLDVRLAQAGG